MAIQYLRPRRFCNEWIVRESRALQHHAGCDAVGRCCCQMEQPAPGPDVEAAAAPTTVTEVFALSSEQLFDFDQATLRSEAAFTLSTMVEKYRGNARLRSITVTGHTDSVGADTYNQSLSQRRADSVRNYLVERGVDGSKISAVDKGESSPTRFQRYRAGPSAQPTCRALCRTRARGHPLGRCQSELDRLGAWPVKRSGTSRQDLPESGCRVTDMRCHRGGMQVYWARIPGFFRKCRLPPNARPNMLPPTS